MHNVFFVFRLLFVLLHSHLHISLNIKHVVTAEDFVPQPVATCLK
nr:MAG TPA: hypothetical protein [Caudoviricetes sp.]DAU12510.1 MAG TPA: hypothetical protein [Caudoviricetes sp.]DAX95928.1 MAG TPA: hypothetical protein [Caudoviricetes sp.]